ncbi:MAG: cupredoxin domain-containing protein [Chloroflexota bacterium]|nr:cupredoxin domain-containing protein [Chloroflexota bacterium]
MRRFLLPAATIGVLIFVTACSGGGGGQNSASAAGSAAGEQRTISASDLEFDVEGFAVPAGEPFSIQFNNNDSAPHNIAIYSDSSRSETLFQGDVIDGGRSTRYDVPALEAGEYYFQCDVHPTMNGTVTAE